MSKKIREGLLKAIDEDEDLEQFISIEHPKRKKEETSPDDYKLYFGSSDLSKFQIRTAGGTVALDNSGFLGVGTRLPSAALHLNRTLRISEVDGYTSDGYASEESDGYTEIVTESDNPSGNSELSIAFNNFGLMGYDINRGSMKIKSVYGKNIVFDAGGAMFDVDNSSERMIITYGGNIGIGTSNPQKRLHIAAESGETPIRVSNLQSGPYSKYLVWDDITGDIFYSESSAPAGTQQLEGILVRYLSVNSDYTIDTHGSGLNDYIVGVDTTNGKVDITLPSSPTKGRYLIIKDSVGNSKSSKIVIIPDAAAGHTIDGINQVDLASDYGSVTIVFDGVGRWMVIGKA
tara:strand:- start:43033 stop:44070 length:1038 start_codon:yes stop_codon:yes gene_type:complete